jgi:signal transduction histidine kinase
VLADDSFFGTLCAIDPLPASVNNAETVGMLRLFAELIAKHIDAGRKLAEVESALEKEREMSELREQFMAVLGHDLRSPMRAVSSFAELLLRTPLSESATKMARLMRDSAFRMRELTDNLLDLARGRRGTGLVVERDASQPLEPVLRQVIDEQTAVYPDRSIDTHFDLAEPVSCDRARVAQLFSNVLGNALSYGAANEPVQVRAVSGSGQFELSIANAGEQIAPTVVERLFQPFYRSSARQNREGLGLGLYIAQEIATAHGGAITVTSTAAETCFTFRMPNA